MQDTILTLLWLDLGNFLMPTVPIFTTRRFMCFSQTLPATTPAVTKKYKYVSKLAVTAPLTNPQNFYFRTVKSHNRQTKQNHVFSC